MPRSYFYYVLFFLFVICLGVSDALRIIFILHCFIQLYTDLVIQNNIMIQVFRRICTILSGGLFVYFRLSRCSLSLQGLRNAEPIHLVGVISSPFFGINIIEYESPKLACTPLLN